MGWGIPRGRWTPGVDVVTKTSGCRSPTRGGFVAKRHGMAAKSATLLTDRPDVNLATWGCGVRGANGSGSGAGSAPQPMWVERGARAACRLPHMTEHRVDSGTRHTPRLASGGSEDVRRSTLGALGLTNDYKKISLKVPWRLIIASDTLSSALSPKRVDIGKGRGSPSQWSIRVSLGKRVSCFGSRSGCIRQAKPGKGDQTRPTRHNPASPKR